MLKLKYTWKKDLEDIIYEFYKIYRHEFDNVINCVRNTTYEAQNSQLKEERNKKDQLY